MNRSFIVIASISIFLTGCTSADFAKVMATVATADSGVHPDCSIDLVLLGDAINKKKGNISDGEFRELFGKFCRKCKKDETLYYGRDDGLAKYIASVTEPSYQVPRSVIEEWQQCIEHKIYMNAAYESNRSLDDNVSKALPSCRIYFDKSERAVADKFINIYQAKIAKQRKIQQQQQAEAQRKASGRVKTSDKKVSISGQAEYFEKSLDPINLSNQEGVVVNTMGEKVIVRVKVNGQDDLFVVNKNQIK